VDIVTRAGESSKVEEKCANIPVDTNFSTWQCPLNCMESLSGFLEKAGCCLYSLEYARFAMAGYPFYIKDLAKACLVQGSTVGLEQPCAGALTSNCGTASVCLGVKEDSQKLNTSSSSTGYRLSNGLMVGEHDSCLCTGVNHYIQNTSGSPMCVDNDECIQGTSACHRDAACINTVGSYICQCNDGFNGDGKDCIAKSCGFFEGIETCVLCGEKCCDLDVVDRSMYTEVLNIGCRAREINDRDRNKRILASPSRHNDVTCLENVTASVADCAGNESVGKPCALWAKHDYFCANVSYPTKYLTNIEDAYHAAFADYSRTLAQMQERPFFTNCSNGSFTNWTSRTMNCTNDSDANGTNATNVPYEAEKPYILHCSN